jgi:hypothetical protein
MNIHVADNQKNFTSLMYWSKTKYGLRDTVPVVMSLIDGKFTLQSSTAVEYLGSVHEIKAKFQRSKLFDEGTLTITTPDLKQYVLGRMPKPLSPLPTQEQLIFLKSKSADVTYKLKSDTDANYTAVGLVIKTMNDCYILLQAWEEILTNNNLSFTPINLEFEPRNQSRRFITISLIIVIIITIIVLVWFSDIFPTTTP